MMRVKSKLRLLFMIHALFALILVANLPGEVDKKALTFQDIMKFKEIQNPVISEDGLWVAYSAEPDRGDGEAKVHGLKNGTEFAVERGSNPAISKNAKWVAMFVKPKVVDLEKEDKEKPKQGLALLKTATGDVFNFEKVERFSFSDNSEWLAFLHFKEEKEVKKETEESEGEKSLSTSIEKETAQKKKRSGSTLVLRHLENGKEIQIADVLSFAFDSASNYLAFSTSTAEGKDNGLYFLELAEEKPLPKTISKEENTLYTNLTWTKEGSTLAFLSGLQDKKNVHFSVWDWHGKTKKAQQIVGAGDIPEEWIIPEKNELSWSKDGNRLFFGLKPADMLEPETEENGKDKEEKEKEEQKEESGDLFDVGKILEKRAVDVWHWNDPLIIPNQKKMWPRLKDQTYLAVVHLDSGKFVRLANREMPEVQVPENAHFALGLSDVPYRKEITWDGRYSDVYIVNLTDGSRTKVILRLADRPSLSPDGRYVVYYQGAHWHLFDRQTGLAKNLTERLDVPFFNEDNDYPQKPPGYGVAGWLERDRAVFIYDKYDIWRFSTKTGEPLNMTGGKGRASSVTYRIVPLDKEKHFFKENERLLLSMYHDHEKHMGFAEATVGKPGIKKLLETKNRYRFLARAKKADVLMYTRESYQEFPDIWVADLEFTTPRKITDVNPQIKDYAWGSAELVEWKSLDGIPLQGVLIKPGNYEPGKRYPVIVYFYRFFSQRLYEYDQTVVNHRPCFPFYASNGYAIFLPDIRFEVGRPGFSATKCIVPGVQKLIDMGIADPGAVGLHGHSWSGYQTAFVITQTNIFACAIAGAPVSNMTSAYGGIRLESGLARQFQYEKTQSRIGGSLWEYPERYIENSPLFFAERIQTPLLIMFGDKDDAVPWYQGIELYLAMRRLGKGCIFLEYRNEPHHLKKYPNKLDYSIRMKEYFDHYLKGMPAPDWIKVGVPYRGK